MGSQEMIAAFLPMLMAIAVIYFLMIRPQKKREQEVKTMRSNLIIGDEVLTVGGVKGRITKLGEDYVTIETSGHTRIEFTRNAIYKVLTETVENEETTETVVETEETEEA